MDGCIVETSIFKKISHAIGYVVLVLSSFLAAAVLVELFFLFMSWIGVPISSINSAVLSAVVATLIYVVALSLAIGLPRLFGFFKTSLREIGLTRAMRWRDILATPLGFLIYIAISSLLLFVVSEIFPSIDTNQVQDTGFDQMSQYYQYIVAFLTLVVVAPVAEEVLFRGFLFGKLKNILPVWVAILLTSAVFGAVHGAWNLAIDTFALSVVLCLLRQTTDGIWSPILLHMTKNAIAYYILFINPLILTTL